MRIDRISIRNFKGFEERTLHFPRPLEAAAGSNGSVHVIIGENGTGKTTALDALAVSMGIWHVACRGYGSRGIGDKEVRVLVDGQNGRVSFVPAGEVMVAVRGEIAGMTAGWSRSRKNLDKNTVNAALEGTAYGLSIARSLVHQTQKLKSTAVLPLLAYYGAGRLWLEPNDRKKIKDGAPKQDKKDLLRFAPYRGCLDSRCRARDLNRWLLDHDWDAYQTGRADPSYELVKRALLKCLPKAARMRFAPLMKEVTVDFEHHAEQPFSNLSDGQRNMLALAGDLAVKAVRLNYAVLGHEVLRQTPGIVLIDEIDLHLHPTWQRVVLENLRSVFPNLQFIATTHSPFIVQTLREGELVMLEGQPLPQTNNQGIEDISRGLMGVDRPEVSPVYHQQVAAAKNFLLTLEEAAIAPEDKLQRYLDRLAEGIDEFADNPAYQAFLELKREAKLGTRGRNGQQ
jgi:predicted ATP-binding protein involved in virulence